MGIRGTPDRTKGIITIVTINSGGLTIVADGNIQAIVFVIVGPGDVRSIFGA